MSNNLQNKKRYYWRGRLVTEKVYKNRLRLSELAKIMNKNNGCKEKCNLTNEDDNQQKDVLLEGRRIVHLETLAEQLTCQECGAILSLIDTEAEERIGLASLLTIKCRQCQKSAIVSTDMKHEPIGQTTKRTRPPLNKIKTRSSTGIKKKKNEETNCQETVTCQNTKLKAPEGNDEPETPNKENVEEKLSDSSETANIYTHYFEEKYFENHYVINVGDFSPGCSSESGDDLNNSAQDPLAL
ncbi:uncharacterized protein LOC106642940 [Copidosoma floridanum]|uniref:uncharacterized protein LOC106642940 n=1 Tax=Copidosoma floridanum TaxID=29053 RepID=UPI0006C945F4|nr:uncharacterized protein LOC106642940 [Copidosoma floridanum]